MDIIKIPEVLIPKRGIDPSKWAVVACDQFTSESAYWEDVEKLTRDAYSAYHISYPEIYLGCGGEEKNARIEKINANMKRYLDEDIFDTVSDGLVLVERTTKCACAPRFGLMIAADLEAYDFKPFNKAYIKATEGTILERLPVRISIRKNALLELPHILLLADDAEKTVIEPLAGKRESFLKLYDFELNKGGGRLRGYKIPGAESKKAIEKLYALADKAVLERKYGGAESNFLLAVGDGNHSLAAAKACWDVLKVSLSLEERKNHPARYALAELVNLYDCALKFEPIHRVIFGAGADFMGGLKTAFKGSGGLRVIDGRMKYAEHTALTSADSVSEENGGLRRVTDGRAEYGEYGEYAERTVPVSADPTEAIRDIQEYIEAYLKTHNEAAVDYIHGEKHLREIVSARGSIGILTPSIDKSELFPYVISNGALPKKAFSMGEAEEKRYYFEAKRIK
ncbi:MAG: DUF1015 domain-containing protein [Clostridiales bacterium]|jgi:hypothetical protein|nr:DUF1015 domain-containing protein [Clostridiales bacterium]